LNHLPGRQFLSIVGHLNRSVLGEGEVLREEVHRVPCKSLEGLLYSGGGLILIRAPRSPAFFGSPPLIFFKAQLF